MLHKEEFIIAAKTFKLIQQLQSLPILKEFYLVGGSALSLQIGHRNSVDIDLFTRNKIVTKSIIQTIKPSHQVEISSISENTLLSVIDNIKTDFIRHNYNLLKRPLTEVSIISNCYRRRIGTFKT